MRPPPLFPENRFNPWRRRARPPISPTISQRAVDLYGAETIAACHRRADLPGEPGSSLPPKGYLNSGLARDFATGTGILLPRLSMRSILCRLRTPPARPSPRRSFDVAPDIMTDGQGSDQTPAISNGLPSPSPTRSIRPSMKRDAGRPPVEFFHHGYTYSGHPVAWPAAGLAVLDIYRERGSVRARRSPVQALLDIVFSLRDLPIVARFLRGYGHARCGSISRPPRSPASRGLSGDVGHLRGGDLDPCHRRQASFSRRPFIVDDSHLDQIGSTLRKSADPALNRSRPRRAAASWVIDLGRRLTYR